MDGRIMKSGSDAEGLDVALIGVTLGDTLERALGTFASRVPSNTVTDASVDSIGDGALVLLGAEQLGSVNVGVLAAKAHVLVVADSVDGINTAALAAAGVSGMLLTNHGPERLALKLETAARGGASWPREAVVQAVTALPGHAEDVTGVEQIPNLTRRQRDVLNLVAKGQSNQTIGDLLGLNLSTVKGHVRGIFTTLGVRNRTQAVLALQHAVARGLA